MESEGRWCGERGGGVERGEVVWRVRGGRMESEGEVVRGGGVESEGRVCVE